MKKFVAILLTLMLVLGVSAAFADEITSVTLKKNYSLEGNGTSPAETFTFTSVPASVADANSATTVETMPNLIGATVSFDGGDAGKGSTKDITFTLPEYKSVGTYTYTVTETASGNAGVTTETRAFKVRVIVGNGETVGSYKVLSAVAYYGDQPNETTKAEQMKNTYSAGTLNVTKYVKGNMGDKNKKFDFTVTFTKPADKNVNSKITAKVAGTDATDFNVAWDDKGTYTYTFQLAHDQTASFANLPYGVTYTVTEVDAKENEKGVLMNGDYEVTKTGDSGTIGAASQTAAFTNTKNGEIDTGVTTENLPYVLLIGFVVLAGAALLIKRKAHNN